ncbi:l-lactate dehydrogenase [Stemphylium lycopersici]|uniref:L-lactate dehydrogenase n=1 Tax=Stemphylium lycopersici TaxID=183478 RepID=A0A364MV47_STELY|nr:l-lactate dehydrogenase [Stemphylium lycopersici]RAR04470.1 l-lactate dehydrogenase [Stemphylium lycopersici]RAR04937.1 l-lactate dehydrogenase [Stemphylium lycopersici]
MSDHKTPHDLNCLTIGELEQIAAERMDKQTRDYYNEGADSGSTLLENIAAYQKYRIRPRVLRDISSIDTTVNVFGHKNSIPLGVAPTAMQCLAHGDGELATARACKNMDVVMGLSSFSTTSLEDVRGALGNHPGALQLYLFEDREQSQKLIQRAKKAGYKAVMLTVDTPVLGRRNLEIRNQFKLPKHLKVANFTSDESQDVGIKVEETTTSTSSAPGANQAPSTTKRPHHFSHARAKSDAVLGTRHSMAERTMLPGNGSLGQRRRDGRGRVTSLPPRRRRHHCFQSWRTTAQRRAGYHRCAA